MDSKSKAKRLTDKRESIRLPEGMKRGIAEFAAQQRVSKQDVMRIAMKRGLHLMREPNFAIAARQ